VYNLISIKKKAKIYRYKVTLNFTTK